MTNTSAYLNFDFLTLYKRYRCFSCFHQATRRATRWGYVNLALNGRARMDCIAPMTSAMNRQNHAKTLPPTVSRRVISVPRINASNLLAGVNSHVVPPLILGRSFL